MKDGKRSRDISHDPGAGVVMGMGSMDDWLCMWMGILCLAGGKHMDPQIDTAQRRAEMSHCRQCGMLCKIGEYHPYAACMMFSHCRDGDTVRANLSAVQQQTRRAALEDGAKAVCMYCNDSRWSPMSNSGYHLCNEPGPNPVRCRATKIHVLLDRLREGVEG